MNKLADRRWLIFTQEFPSIALLSAIAIWDGFNSPGLMNLGVSWNIINSVIKSSFGIILVVYLFVFQIDKFAPYIKLEYIKDTFHASAATNRKVAILALITEDSIGIIFMWYARHLLGISNFYYVSIWAYLVLMWALLYRAACRVDSSL